MNPFIHYTEDQRHYLLQRAQPHYLAEITTYPENALCFAQLPGYSLFVVFKGTLSGHGLLLHRTWKEDIQQTTYSMMEWFLTHKILPNEKKYSKFLVEYHLNRNS